VGFGVSVTLYANAFCVGVCVGVSVTLYANVAGDDVCVLVYLSPCTLMYSALVCVCWCICHSVR